MTYIDSALLNLVEWLCQRLQRLTGRTNVWLAVQLTNVSVIVYFVWVGVYFWTSDLAVRTAVALFCGGLMYALTQTIFRVPIETYENDAYQRVAKGLRNPRRVRDALLRISFLTLSVVLFYPVFFVSVNLRAYINFRVHLAFLSYFLIVLTTIVLYVLACDPLPPCAGKVREWLRGAIPSRLTAPESAGNAPPRQGRPSRPRHAAPFSGLLRRVDFMASRLWRETPASRPRRAGPAPGTWREASRAARRLESARHDCRSNDVFSLCQRVDERRGSTMNRW